MDYVAEEVRKGHKKNNTLDKEGWGHVRERFLNESNVTVSLDQLRNRFDKTGHLWQGWRYLATQTGLGWDHIRLTYTALDSFWEGFKKMHKDGYQLRWRGLSGEEEQYLQTIYGGSVATGEDRWNPSSGTIPPNEDELVVEPVEPLGDDDQFTNNLGENIPPNVEETILPNVEENIHPNVEENIHLPTTEQMNTPTQPQSGTRSRNATYTSLPQPPTRQ